MKLITLDGCDGVGKTSQLLVLKAKLESCGYRVYCSFEPFGAPVFDDCRFGMKQLLRKKDAIRTDSEVMCYLISRLEHIAHLLAIEKEYDIAIIDRFADSTEAYQCCGLGFDVGRLGELQRLLHIDRVPDVTLILDADYNIAASRQTGTLCGYYYESLGRSFYDSVRDGFLAIANRYPERIEVIDANPQFDSVSESIMKAVEKRLNIKVAV